MKLIFRYLKKYKGAVALAIFIKLIGTLSELLLPYILEHIIDDVVPLNNLKLVIFWGLMMFVVTILCRYFNVKANGKAIDNAHRISYEVRQALFEKTMNLTGSQFDAFTLPSLISRMTSDSYNVQSAVQQFQTLCVRAP
ncbi:MAG: ABC transporter transmembrane domain-containing protein, partial [Erysipelotrichaceae bacterium]|nr:ABC transporter transmembrane domain-containing protein [Erysipelotrichaceae bacterium]